MIFSDLHTQKEYAKRGGKLKGLSAVFERKRKDPGLILL